MFHVSSKSIKGFWSPWGRNLPIPITLAIGFYNSLHYRASRDYNKPCRLPNKRCNLVVQSSVLLAPFLSLCHVCEILKNFVFVAALEYVGPIPYDILKPVLECCTPARLYSLEDFNPVSLSYCNVSRFLFGNHFVKNVTEYLVPGRGANCEGLRSVCLYVCLSTYISQKHTSKHSEHVTYGHGAVLL